MSRFFANDDVLFNGASAGGSGFGAEDAYAWQLASSTGDTNWVTQSSGSGDL
jgi:hypothetical protein